MTETEQPDLQAWEDLALISRAGEGYEVAPYEARWAGSHTLTPFWNESRVVGVFATGDADEKIRALLDAAASRRRKSFRRCTSCGELTPPEHREGLVCHGCMQQGGVIF